MNNKIGKYIALLLRHDPKGLEMDENGWVNVKDLLPVLKIDITELTDIVNTDDKQRYSFNNNKTKIRANQGHSIPWVHIHMEEKDPPEFLYHGTSTKFLHLIMKEGLKRMSRQHIHLSADEETAKKVGLRHAHGNIKQLVVLKIHASRMKEDSEYKIYLSENGVWLVGEKSIDPSYIHAQIYY